MPKRQARRGTPQSLRDSSPGRGSKAGPPEGRTTQARLLRKRMTEPELILWSQLRKGQVGGHKFRRQHPVGPYVVDFACLKARLIIEVDGGHHSTQRKDDRERDANLAALGFTVLRIWNDDVRHNLSGVLDRIASELQYADRVE